MLDLAALPRTGGRDCTRRGRAIRLRARALAAAERAGIKQGRRRSGHARRVHQRLDSASPARRMLCMDLHHPHGSDFICQLLHVPLKYDSQAHTDTPKG